MAPFVLLCNVAFGIVFAKGLSRGIGSNKLYVNAAADPKVNADSSADVPEKMRWGIYIDGRNAGKGKDAYGLDYGKSVSAALNAVYQSSDKSKSTTGSHDTVRMLVELFKHIRSQGLHEPWREYPNPCESDVALCRRKVLPSSYSSSLMANVAVMNQTFKMNHEYGDIEERLLECRKYSEFRNLQHFPAFRKLQEYPGFRAPSQQSCNDIGARWIDTFTILVQHYVDKLPKDPKSDSAQSLKALGWFLYNLAYLHPLSDGNGRSRLLLMQHELRRLGIARGTFMYNNNKDIYFTPLDIYISKIREGIDMYRKAAASGLNPWIDESNLKSHVKMYDHGYNKALEACWAAETDQKANAGTLPTLF